jgi:transposase-like protein
MKWADFRSCLNIIMKSYHPIRLVYQRISCLSLLKTPKTPSENALFKLVFCAIKQITAKWTMPMPNWALTLSQLDIYFPDRLFFRKGF